jgi:DNA (cytosine-5)-methyltransferase 1
MMPWEMHALYNEIDPFATQWLENLVDAGHIAAGCVERRSVRDLTAVDVAGPGQRHFFAGIGVWSAALRDAGIPDDADVWTGSCPCQPFSTAGRKKGTADDRHLWPTWFRLIEECRPPVIFGEQVASPDGRAWLDAVLGDLEGAGYSCGASNLSAGGVGAPHQRQRLYFVAFVDGERLERIRVQLRKRRPRPTLPEASGSDEVVGVADADDARWQARSRQPRSLPERGWEGSAEHCDAIIVADSDDEQPHGRREARRRRGESTNDRDALVVGDVGVAGGGRHAGAVPRMQAEGSGRGHEYRCVPNESVPTGTTRGHWSDAGWLLCRDGKARPVEPMPLTVVDGSPFGMGPLCSGVPCRTGRLRGYGNAIVRQCASTFIRAAFDVLMNDFAASEGQEERRLGKPGSLVRVQHPGRIYPGLAQ